MKNTQLTILAPGLADGLVFMRHEKNREFSRFFGRINPYKISYDADELKFSLIENVVPDELPVAFLSALADDLDSDGYWMRADPVNLNVDMAHIYFLGGKHLALSIQEIHGLHQLISPLLEEFNIKLIMPHAERWYLNFHDKPIVTTYFPNDVVGKSIVDYFPHGEHSAFLLRLTTEIQMLLLECDINKRRRALNLPTVDALWFWGQGEHLKKTSVIKYSEVFTDDEVVIGLAKYSGLNYKFFNGEINEFMKNCSQPSGNYLLVTNQFLDYGLEKNKLCSMTKQFFLPILKELQAGKVSKLVLYPGNKDCYDATPKKLASWWRI